MTRITMDNLLVIIVNGPLTLLNIFANIFFASCMLCPPHGREGLKQPVKLLLGSMVFCTTVYLVSLIAAQCLWMVSPSSEFFNVAYLIMVYMASTSMSTSVWLNFFYYTQIVPAQRALFTWVKRNIKSIIYWGLFGDRMFFMFQFAVRAAGEFYSSEEWSTNSAGFTSTNGTSNVSPKKVLLNNTTTSTNATPKDDAASPKVVLLDTSTASLFLEMIYVLFCVCVMVGSSCATVRYLNRHMKSMKESGSPFSSTRLHSQMRVTIAGILQGIIYFFTAVWIFIHYLSNVLSSTYFDDKTLYTVISLYMFSTTLNLGIGQVVFRQRAADIWIKAQQAVKSLKP